MFLHTALRQPQLYRQARVFRALAATHTDLPRPEVVCTALCTLNHSFTSKIYYSNVPKVSKRISIPSLKDEDIQDDDEAERSIQTVSASALRKKRISYAIASCKNLPELVEVIHMFVEMSAEDAILLLRKIHNICSRTPLSEEEARVFIRSDAFLKLMGHVQGHMFSDNSVLYTVYPLVVNIFPREVDIIQNLQIKVVASLDDAPVGDIVRLITSLAHSTSQLRHDIEPALIMALDRRWSELSRVQDIVSVLHLTPHRVNIDSLLTNVESLCLDHAGALTGKQVYRVLYMMSRRQRVNPKLVSALAERLTHTGLDLSAVHLANLLYALASYSVYHLPLFQQVRDAMMRHIKRGDLTTAFALSMVKSMGMLRWREPDLLDSLSTILVPDYELFHRLIRTCAELDHLPHSVDVKIPEFIVNLPLQLESNPLLYLHNVFSLAVLSRADEVLIEPLFEPKIQEVLATYNSHEAPIIKRKLMSLKFMAQTQLNSDKPLEILETILNVQSPSEKANACQVQLETLLSILIPQQKMDEYTRYHVISQSGHMISLQVVADSEGSMRSFPPVAFNESSPQQSCGDDTLKATGQAVVSVRCLPFFDWCVSCDAGTRLVGSQRLARSQLVAEGHRLVDMPLRLEPSIAKQLRQFKSLLAEAVAYGKTIEGAKAVADVK